MCQWRKKKSVTFKILYFKYIILTYNILLVHKFIIHTLKSQQELYNYVYLTSLFKVIVWKLNKLANNYTITECLFRHKYTTTGWIATDYTRLLLYQHTIKECSIHHGKCQTNSTRIKKSQFTTENTTIVYQHTLRLAKATENTKLLVPAHNGER